MQCLLGATAKPTMEEEKKGKRMGKRISNCQLGPGHCDSDVSAWTTAGPRHQQEQNSAVVVASSSSSGGGDCSRRVDWSAVESETTDSVMFPSYAACRWCHLKSK